MRCAYLTMQDPGDFVTDHELAIGPMEKLGWTVERVPWRDPDTDWDSYDAVYICTPWDYPENAEQFLQVLERIEASRALLVNPLEVVRWNLKKTYMRDLEERGADIVPSTWFEDFPDDVSAFFDAQGDKVVIKPLVGGSSTDIYVLSNPLADKYVGKLRETFDGRPFFIQPFIQNIQSEGEYSLFYFNAGYSHAILKSPAADDFRVQEEYGADILSVEPPAKLIEAASKVLGLVTPPPAYARADFVRGDDGRFLVMELELIEPSLYLRTNKDAPARFARAFDSYARGQAGR